MRSFSFMLVLCCFGAGMVSVLCRFYAHFMSVSCRSCAGFMSVPCTFRVGLVLVSCRFYVGSMHISCRSCAGFMSVPCALVPRQVRIVTYRYRVGVHDHPPIHEATLTGSAASVTCPPGKVGKRTGYTQKQKKSFAVTADHL